MRTTHSNSVRAAVVALNCLFLIAWITFYTSVFLTDGVPFGIGDDLLMGAFLAMAIGVPISVAGNTYSLLRPGSIPPAVLAILWIFSAALVFMGVLMYVPFVFPALGPTVWTPIVMIHRWNPTNSP